MLHVDRDRLAGAYDRSPTDVRHDLEGHPLLQLDALATFAAGHPTELVEHNVGQVPVELPGGVAPQAELDPQELVAGIHENGCWLVLKNIELDPRYKQLLDELLDELATSIPGKDGTDLHREGFIFVSAPNAVTPAHVDPEQNILLQASGKKFMHVGEFENEAVRVRELERFYSGDHRNIETRPARERTFEMDPGDGVYVPPNAPHWVQNGDGASISLSITWRTPRTRTEGTVWAMNHRLRASGRTPSAPGTSRLADSTKVAAHHALRVKRKLTGGRA